MIIFNTTFHLEDDVHPTFVDYMLRQFIPACTKSGLLTNPRLARVHGTDNEGYSYAMEFSVTDVLTLEKWNSEESAGIYRKLTDTFNDKVIGFSTVMQTVEY